jgi:outer membrane receptor protein involved in Fe transport
MNRATGLRNRSTHWLAASALLVGLLGSASGPAFAQQPGDKSPDEKAEDLNTVVVTGSRIRRSDLDAASPVAVVDSQQIRDSGNATIENTLNELPQLAAGMNSQTNANGGANGSASGVLSANLRALGATRTLVLVNGRRYVSANQDGIVDLASIPDMLVERVEVMTGGASAVYGSDAIAGAVNFILKKDIQGIEASYMYGQTGESDGETHKVDLAMGTNFADGRGNITAYGSYTQRDAIMFADREFSAVSLNEGPDGLIPGGSGNVPGTKIALGATQLAGLHGVTLPAPGSAGCTNLGGVRFGEGGEVLPYCTPQDLYNFAPDNYLQRPMSRAQVNALTSYEFATNTEAYAEMFYVDTRNAFQQAPQSGGLNTPGVDPSAFVVPDYGHNPILLAPVRQFFINNPQLFDPDGVYNNDPAHPELDTAYVPGTGRRGTETGPRHNDYERTSLNMTAGLRGEFSMSDNPWHWDSFFQYQRSRTDQMTEGVYSQTRVGLGADVVIDDDGNAACRVGNAFGCVPVNPFGIGSITPEAGAFVATLQTSKEVFERRVAGASLSGDTFELPAGPVGVAVGVEWRKDQYEFLPGATDLAGEYGPDSRGITAGEYDLTEFFAEVRVPLLADKSFAKELSLEAAGRQSDYSTFGSATTWKVGLEWAPTDWLRFRSAFNRALRAPTLGELYAPISNGFTGATDPCEVGSHPTAEQKALCVEQGIPAGDIDTFTSTNQGFGASSGGNPNLTPEDSDTFTVGAVLTFASLGGMHITLDYFDIQVDDAISTIDVQKTLNGCFTLLDNSSPLCQSIHRTAGNGQIEFVTAQLANIGSLAVSGIDFAADYTTELPGALAIGEHGANLRLALAVSKTFERSTQVQGFEPDDCAGFIGSSCSGQDTFAVPDIKASLNARWESGPLSVRAGLRYIGSMGIFPGTDTVVKGAGSQTYFDLGGTFSLGEATQIQIGVDNVSDEQPPVLGAALAGDANTDTSLYDVIGRRYFVSLGVRF